jgi:transcriptional regulator with XRE-family HTH domain
MAPKPSPLTGERIRRRLGQRIKAARVEQRLTQVELAARAQVDNTYICRLEAGKVKRFDLGALARVRKVLGLNREEDVSVEAAS